MNHRETVLYIEDDHASRKLVQRLLESRGHRVIVAADGLEGIALAKRENPSLILMDINLPTMDGQEITTRLRTLPHFERVPIIAVTANTGPGSREQALAAGCSGFLTKPIDAAAFPSQVDSFLRGHSESLAEQEQGRELQRYAQRLVARLEDKIQELEAANQKLRNLDKLKGDFIVLVSHELRTPLTLISGYVFVLQEWLRSEQPLSDRERLTEAVDGLSTGVERLERVVSEIIRFSRIAAGTLELAIGPVRIRQILERAIETVQEAGTERLLQVELAPMKDIPLIEADGAQLEVALANLVGNAVKFTPDGGRVSISARQIGQDVQITVADNGVGVDSDQQQLIFEQFQVAGAIQHHTSSSIAFGGGGVGLGLAIAKGIIEAHSGRIWVESPGYDPVTMPGSSFHVIIPVTHS